MASLFDLTGKVAIVTGASRGIGAAIAAALAEAGASVVIASRKQESVDAVAAQIRAQGGAATAIAAHTGDAAAVTALVDATVAAYSGVDILVNNAATNPHFGPLLSAEESHWDKTFDVNIKGYLRMIKACVPAMQVRGGGKVINLASIAGKIPQPGMGVYCVTKAGVIMLTEVLAAELAPLNIQVNAIAPGFVRTRFSEALWASPLLSEAIERVTPQGRIAEPDEIVAAALYLASAASSFTTGSVLVVDGGVSLGAISLA